MIEEQGKNAKFKPRIMTYNDMTQEPQPVDRKSKAEAEEEPADAEFEPIEAEDVVETEEDSAEEEDTNETDR